MRTLLPFGALLWTVSLAAQTDSFGNAMTGNGAYSYLDISGTGAAVLAGADDETATLTLPFGFRFYGVSYTQVCVSPNGLIGFGGCVANDYTNLDLTAQVPVGDRSLLAVLWSDLTFAKPGGGAVYYQTLGTAPARRFVVQWKGASPVAADGDFDFQAILSEGSGAIVLQYRSLQSGTAGWSQGGRATAGLRSTGAPANGFHLQWSYNAPALADGFALAVTPPPASAVIDVNSSLRITTSAFSFNRFNRTYTGTVTLQNTSNQAVARPLNLVLANLTPGVTALATSGSRAGEGPFYAVPGTGSLAPGQSVAVPVQFDNPANALIQFTPRVYSGTL